MTPADRLCPYCKTGHPTRAPGGGFWCPKKEQDQLTSANSTPQPLETTNEDRSSSPSVSLSLQQPSARLSDVDRDSVIATTHGANTMFNDIKWFTELHRLEEPLSVLCASGKTLSYQYIGTVTFQAAKTAGGIHDATWKNVRYVPEAIYNQFSLAEFAWNDEPHHNPAFMDGRNNCFVDAAGEELCSFKWINDRCTLEIVK